MQRCDSVLWSELKAAGDAIANNDTYTNNIIGAIFIIIGCLAVSSGFGGYFGNEETWFRDYKLSDVKFSLKDIDAKAMAEQHYFLLKYVILRKQSSQKYGRFDERIKFINATIAKFFSEFKLKLESELKEDEKKLITIFIPIIEKILLLATRANQPLPMRDMMDEFVVPMSRITWKENVSSTPAMIDSLKRGEGIEEKIIDHAKDLLAFVPNEEGEASFKELRRTKESFLQWCENKTKISSLTLQSELPYAPFWTKQPDPQDKVSQKDVLQKAVGNAKR